jgi:hypothetical protein
MMIPSSVVADLHPEEEQAMTKIVKVLVLVLMLTVMLPISPAQACACGVPDWSMMSDEEIVSTINAAEDVPRIMAAENGEFPPAPAGYQYTEDYKLIAV